MTHAVEKLAKYTKEVQEEILDTLKAYNECHVERHGTTYKVCVSWCLKAHYGDEEIMDEFKAEEVYTNEERILNYVEVFHSYPITYKGKRDYKMIHEIEGNWEAKFAYDEDGNIIRIA